MPGSITIRALSMPTRRARLTAASRSRPMVAIGSGMGASLAHISGPAAHVIQDQAGVVVGDDPRELRLDREAGGIVDDFHAEFQRALGDLGLIRVHRDRDRQPVFQALQHRDQAAELFGRGDARRARLGGFGADVDDVGAHLFEFDGAREGAVRVGILAAVGEGIGRDVEDAQDHRPLAKLDFPLFQFPEVKLSHRLLLSHFCGG